MRDFTTLPSGGACGTKAAEDGGHVAVARTPKRAWASGLFRCSSLWACPTCAPRIRAERGGEIAQAIEAHVRGGGSLLLLLTLTVPHRQGDSLAWLIRGLFDAYRRLLQHRGFREVFRRALGCEARGAFASIRVVEVTYSDTAGFHPHLHALLFLSEQPSRSGFDEAEVWLRKHWPAAAVAEGLRRPSGSIGSDLRRASGSKLARYVTKLTKEVRGLAAEVAHGDMKRRSVWDLLDRANSGDANARKLWREYEQATKDARMMWWSPGLCERLGVRRGGSAALAAQREGDPAEEPEVVAYFEDEAWREVSRRRLVPHLLIEAHRGGYLAVAAFLDRHGLPPPMVGDPFAPYVAALP